MQKGILSLTMLAWLWYLLELLPTLPKPKLRRKVSHAASDSSSPPC